MEKLISKSAAMILDLLEQIESVNEMVVLHSDDSFMLEQYRYRKEQFVKELAQLLSEYGVQPEDLAA